MAAQHGPAGIPGGPVGMVGTGNMGGRMTRRMVEAGHDVLAVTPTRPGFPPAAPCPPKTWRTLTLMVGGDAGALARVRPLLGTFSAHVHTWAAAARAT